MIFVQIFPIMSLIEVQKHTHFLKAILKAVKTGHVVTLLSVPDDHRTLYKQMRVVVTLYMLQEPLSK